MSPLGWLLFGAFSMLGVVAALFFYVIYLFTRQDHVAFHSLAAMIRVVANATGYRSVVVRRDPEPLVVGFEDLASAVERGDVRSHAPVGVHRSDPPPPNPPPSGGYDGRH